MLNNYLSCKGKKIIFQRFFLTFQNIFCFSSLDLSEFGNIMADFCPSVISPETYSSYITVPKRMLGFFYFLFSPPKLSKALQFFIIILELQTTKVLRFSTQVFLIVHIFPLALEIP